MEKEEYPDKNGFPFLGKKCRHRLRSRVDFNIIPSKLGAMLDYVFSCAVIGLDGVIIDIEVDFGQGLPHMAIVGLPDEAVKESRERVYSAIKNADLAYPRKALTVNLAPISVRKEGPSFDLPIALGVLIAAEQVSQSKLKARW